MKNNHRSAIEVGKVDPIPIVAVMTVVLSVSLLTSSYGNGQALSINVGIINYTGNQGHGLSPFENSLSIVWQDNTTGNNEIYLKKSTDGGVTFGNATKLSESPGSSESPQIESEGNSTFVVWQDNTTGNNEIYLKKSTDGSVTFGNAKKLSERPGSSESPQIESEGNSTFVVWQDNTTGNNEIYLKKSTDGGVTFYEPKQPPKINTQYPGGPVVSDPNLKVEIVTRGINFPTHMAFLGNNDLLVLEKNNGTVKRIVDGRIQNASLLDVAVANGVERGMLGIDVKKTRDGPTFVFLYFTESLRDGDDVSSGKVPLGNRLYRYELVNNRLVNPKLLLDLPSTPGSAHNGGKVIVGPDGNVYLSIGDLDRSNAKNASSIITKAQNHVESQDADGRAGILRVTVDGQPVNGGILGKTGVLNKYFAYGIRNSFGMDFDPLTGKLWDTENGPEYGDEINLVESGFNSGWNKVQGIWEPNENSFGPIKSNFTDLFDFNGTGHYHPPVLSWYQPPPGLTAIKFLNSAKMGQQNANDLFVGDFHNGNIYHFKLNANRTGLELESVLGDKVASNLNETGNVTFARGFGGITDMQVGPDGYLYVLSLYKSADDCTTSHHSSKPCISYNNPLEGTVFRIRPKA